MDDIVLMEVVDGVKHLPDSLRGVLFGELALLADAVEELPARRQLGDDVVLVLQNWSAPSHLPRPSSPGPRWAAAYPRLEPVDEAHNVRVLQALQEVQLVVHHALVAPDVLLQDDLNGDLALRRVGLADDAIGSGAEGATELVFGSAHRLDTPLVERALGGAFTSCRSFRAGRRGGSACWRLDEAAVLANCHARSPRGHSARDRGVSTGPWRFDSWGRFVV